MADQAPAAQLASASLEDKPSGEAAAPQVVTPWDVQSGASGIDYDKLLTSFGCQSIDANLIARCEQGVASRRRSGVAALALTVTAAVCTLCAASSASRAQGRTCCCGAACSLLTGARVRRCLLLHSALRENTESNGVALRAFASKPPQGPHAAAGCVRERSAELLPVHRSGKKATKRERRSVRSSCLLSSGVQGPSSEALHLGHLIPFHFTKWLQDAFKARAQCLMRCAVRG